MSEEELADFVEFSDCERQRHDEHLCSLLAKGLHEFDPKQYRELVMTGEFICQKCGRTARKEENLCLPKKL